ncbi:MAG: type IV secretion system protein [Aeromonas sp.]
MSDGVITTMLKTIDTVVTSGISANVGKIAGAVSPIFAAGLALYIVYIAYEIMYSQRDIVMNEVSKTIMVFALVSAFTYAGPYYAQYVVPFVMHAGNDLSSAVLGTTNTGATVDNLWDTLIISLEKYRTTATERLDAWSIGGWIEVYLLYGIGVVGGVILMYYSALFLCVSMFMMGILLSVGVIFISFAAFPATRSMFTAWCGHCLNYIMLNVFYTIAFSFLVSFIEAKTVVDPENINIMSIITMLLIIMVSVFLIEQLASLSSSLTGGVSLSGLNGAASGSLANAKGAIKNAVGAKNIAKGAKNMASKAIGSRLSNGGIKGG